MLHALFSNKLERTKVQLYVSFLKDGDHIDGFSLLCTNLYVFPLLRVFLKIISNNLVLHISTESIHLIVALFSLCVKLLHTGIDSRYTS